MSDQIKKIKQLITRGKEYKALAALVEVLKSEKNSTELLNNAFLLQARLEGIESKFNQGITSYEKWEISRNKILKSTLDLINKVDSTLSLVDSPVEVDKIEVQESKATNSTFVHRLANPALIRKMSFYYLILWILLGAFDTLFFQVQDPDLLRNNPFSSFGFNRYVANESIVTWLKDFIGHLFAFGTVIIIIILEIAKSNLSRTSTMVLNEVNVLYKKYFLVYLFAGIGLIVGAIVSNAYYTTQQSSVILWSAEIAPHFLPPFIAINYFALVMIPLLLGLFHYCLLLHVSIKEFKSFSSYNPFHGDKNFGLLLIGRSIFWGTLSFVVLMLMALILQLILKNGELTFGIFSGTLLFIVLVWFGAINPLKKLSMRLRLEKERLYESVKEEVRSNNRMLGNQSSAEDLNTVKLLLDASRDNERELLELNTLPIRKNELLIGAALLFLLLGMIVYQIS